MKAIVLLLAVMMLTCLMTCVVDARSLKYSEIVNVSATDFAESINKNVSALLHEIELASEAHNYDAIVKSADLIAQNKTIVDDMIHAFNMADLRDQSDQLYRATKDNLDEVGLAPTWGIIRDARARVEEKNAEIAEQTRIAELARIKNETTTSTVSSIPNNGFGNYTFDGQNEVRATVKKGTDVVHMMAMEELPTDYGYTKDSAQYTVTSTGHKIKGYLDYTSDGYVVIMTPRSSSLTKSDFMDILNTFQRVD